MRSPRSPGRAAAAVGRIRCSWELCLPGSLATPLPPAWRVPSWWPQTWGIGTEKPTTFLPRGVLPRCWASSTLGQEGGLCPCKFPQNVQEALGLHLRLAAGWESSHLRPLGSRVCRRPLL